jgi:hypothetical protein
MSIPIRLRIAVLARDGYRCVYCGRRPPDVQLEADHVVPRAQGGTGTDTNLVSACQDCNGGKSDLPLGLIRPEPVGLIRRLQGGAVQDRGIALGHFRWCSDRCPTCAVETLPAFLQDGDARAVELAYRCPTGHPWHAWFEPRMARIHCDTVRFWSRVPTPA